MDFPAPQATEAVPPLLAGRTVAVARDAAFTFIYAANLQTLEELGARLCFFSPLAGDRLPPCDAVWLPGGYPELHAARIAANTGLRADLLRHLDGIEAVMTTHFRYEEKRLLPVIDDLDLAAVDPAAAFGPLG